MVALRLLKQEPGSASFRFFLRGRQASYLVVDADRQLSIKHMNGDSVEALVPLGEATPENLQMLRTRLDQIENLISYLPPKRD